MQLPGDPEKICHTYITETNNLYIVTKKDGVYRFQYLDLDAGKESFCDKKLYKKFNIVTLFEYSLESVNNKPIIAIHVRGSSEKEDIDNNERLIISIIHEGGDLYYWS